MGSQIHPSEHFKWRVCYGLKEDHFDLFVSTNTPQNSTQKKEAETVKVYSQDSDVFF